ncbi:hypothetical protein TRFO_42619 [Tritrichomonas foetus]|uniref:Reverse transcriptase domain-containing protein n=1 Tax=Tritrichomonas foetus TaxID=1144522 RepID=A0A1J4L088_9EUKA|nr:hypothetical protein TRFO_42619 [Tritrichomonas foetus]|eukprot:OHT15269.1 hypothetical protein TRFO_42619 [Tritrichomonas foetus]
MIYKKGDASSVRAWRPISVSSTLYRLVFCNIARTLQELNGVQLFINSKQKGFMSGIEGAAEHIATLNELVHNAVRKNESIYITALDFNNAFGSIPHEMITWSLKAKGFPDYFVSLIKDAYRSSSTKFLIGSNGTRDINTERGVKQGCPLSPTLFNLCLEPLLSCVTPQHAADGVVIELDNDDPIKFNIQANADDVVLVANTEEGMSRMLKTVEEFCTFSGMSIAAKKSVTLAYIQDGNRRNTLATPLRILGEEIPIASLDTFVEYLGSPVATTRSGKKAHSRRRINKVRSKIEAVFSSSLKITQKLDAVIRLVTPKLDYEMLNGVLPLKDLDALDAYIRGKVNSALNTSGLPSEFFYTHWKDGGLSLMSMVERDLILQVRTFTHLLKSKDVTTKSLFLQSMIDESAFRRIDDSCSSPFFNVPFDDDDMVIQGSEKKGTSCLFIRAARAARKLKVSVYTKFDSSGSEYSLFQVDDLSENDMLHSTSDNSVNVSSAHTQDNVLPCSNSGDKHEELIESVDALNHKQSSVAAQLNRIVCA